MVTIDCHRDVYCVYLKTHDADVYLSVVVRYAQQDGQALYSRTLELLRDELTDGEENQIVDPLQRTTLDRVFNSEYMRGELRLLSDRCPTGLHDNDYGVQLFHCDDIESLIS